MMNFQYDIAFSFTKEDEGVATQINDLLQDRYQTFLYSSAQEKLAGTDGEGTFNAVLKEQARLVAVLLRPEWGAPRGPGSSRSRSRTGHMTRATTSRRLS